MKVGLLAFLFCVTGAAQSLRVYAIDTEGGKATLYVSPSGESMLVDTGYDGYGGRDAERILAAARDAGVKQIDWLLITHYHVDHIGGVAQLAARIPIRRFVDHGMNFETKDVGGLFESYDRLRKKGTHIVVKAGDQVPLTGVRVDVVTASGKALAQPLSGTGKPNPECAHFQRIAEDTGENAHSIGVILTLGRFRLSDLGDLYWNQEGDLACPNNLVGTVDVYMSTHHGKRTSGAPALIDALRPRAAIINNGPQTGAVESHWATIHDSPEHPDIWQLHYASTNEKRFNAPHRFIANLEGAECQGRWILLEAWPDGRFVIRNTRTNHEKRYAAKN